MKGSIQGVSKARLCSEASSGSKDEQVMASCALLGADACTYRSETTGHRRFLGVETNFRISSETASRMISRRKGAFTAVAIGAETLMEGLFGRAYRRHRCWSAHWIVIASDEFRCSCRRVAETCERLFPAASHKLSILFLTSGTSGSGR